MVAITVVLAAVVFVLVSNLGEGSDSAPTLGINADDSDSRFALTSAPNGLTWDLFNLKADAAVTASLNAPATAAVGTDYTAGVAAPAGASTDAVTGGDFFDLCGATASVTIQVIHIPTNTQVYSHTFPAVPACA